MKLLTHLMFFLAIACAGYTQIQPSLVHQPYTVGELGTKWEFPSDHLPRGATIGELHIAFWNILNKDYLNHIEENSQGLCHSAIMRDNVPLTSESSLTMREAICVGIILEMINHPTHPRSLIALQETHWDVQNLLEGLLFKDLLPTQWRIVTPPGQRFSQDLFLYDKSVFDFVDVSATKYSEKFAKTIFTLTLKEKASGRLFRFVQSHIPGGPNSAAGCTKFAEVALSQYEPDLTVVLMGDMNQSPDYIENALAQTAQRLSCNQPFTYLPIAHPSHVNTHLEASWIDHFFVSSSKAPIMASNNAEELSWCVADMARLLVESKKDK